MHNNFISNISFKVLVARVAREVGLSQKVVYKVLTTTFDIIKENLWNRITTVLPRFGVFTFKIIEANMYVLPNGSKVWKNRRLKPVFNFYHKLRKNLSEIPLDKDESIDDLFLEINEIEKDSYENNE